MKITLLRTGKLHFDFAESGFEQYAKRLKHYCRFSDNVLELSSKHKTSDEKLQKKREGETMLKKVSATDYLILLDESGRKMNSVQFAGFINKLSLQHTSLVFAIGGAYGFAEEVKKRADIEISLSEMTFSHQLVPLIFTEQLYRAFSIIKGEPYHHE